MMPSTTTTTAAAAEQQQQQQQQREARRIMVALVKTATEGRVRVSGRVHTGGDRPEFVGTVFPADAEGDHIALEVTSRESFSAHFDGVTNDTLTVELNGEAIECEVDAWARDGAVRIHVNAVDPALSWFWMELYAAGMQAAASRARRTLAAPRRR